MWAGWLGRMVEQLGVGRMVGEDGLAARCGQDGRRGWLNICVVTGCLRRVVGQLGSDRI